MQPRFRKISALALLLMLSTTAPLMAQEAAKVAVSPITRVAGDPNWLEEHAYTLGVQAYEFAFPWYYNSLLRWRWSLPAANDRTPSLLQTNQFWHSRQMSSAKFRDGGTPNNDTPYSFAMLDVSKEPVIISVPPVKDRYFSVQLTGFDTDNFAYIGTRSTGSAGGNFAVVGPDWKGKLPKGVKPLPPSHTGVAIAAVRIMATAPEAAGQVPMTALNALQDKFILTPLSRWGKPGFAPIVYSKPLPPFNHKDDPLVEWKTINRALAEVPVPARHARYLQQFAHIGIGPGLDVEVLDPATKRGLNRALDAGKRLVTGAAITFARATTYDGWNYHSPLLGRFGEADDFVARAGIVSLAGIIAHDNAEALYIASTNDAEGKTVSGKHRYVLRFAKDQLPPVNAFWSVTAYGLDFNLIDNPLNRYSLGDRNPLVRDADGGLTLYVQRDNPGPAKELNWLPVGDEAFKLTMRLYLPRAPALDRSWRAPPLRRLD
jgi:hypothetical protein